jgi:hypothetical protein
MFWLLLITGDLLARMDSFAKLRKVLLVGFAEGCIVLRRLRCESSFEGRDRDCYSTARTNGVSHAGANGGIDLWSEAILRLR